MTAQRPAKYLQTRHLTTLLALITTVAILLCNITVLVWYKTTAPVSDNTKPFYSGSCAEVSRISTWAHLGINVFSTVLLAGSNFCTLDFFLGGGWGEDFLATGGFLSSGVSD